MPRKGPRRPTITIRISDAGRELLNQRAQQEADGNVSELARRMLKYATLNMPKGWQ